MQEGTEKQKVEAVMTCWGACVQHLCHLQMYTRTRTSIHLIPPPDWTSSPLGGEKNKQTEKQKAVIGQHTRSKRKKILTNRVGQKFCPRSVESQLFLHLCSLERSPELQVKGNDLTLLASQPLEGTLRLWAALTVRIGAGRAGVRVGVAVVVLRRALFPQSPLDGSETGQQTLVVKTTPLLSKRILREKKKKKMLFFSVW